MLRALNSEMAMSFEESLKAICKEILPSTADFSSYNEDAEKIRNHLLKKMRAYDADFKAAFNGLTSNSKHWVNELPDEFDFYIELEMPFAIKPHEDLTRQGFIKLATPSGTVHSLVSQNCVSRKSLQDWIRNILLNVIDDKLSLTVNGRNYVIEYPLHGRGYGVVHTISAKEVRNGKREFSFDLVPAFKFNACKCSAKSLAANVPWLAVPFGKKMHNDRERSNEFAFMACTSNWEREVLYDKQNLRNSLRLMKVIRDVKNLELLTNYMLKSIYLEELEVRSNEFWEQPVGVILIEMLEVLQHALRHNHLPFFLDKRFKQLRLLRKELNKMYPIQLNLILKNLRHFQKQSSVNYADVTVFSYIRSNCKHQ